MGVMPIPLGPLFYFLKKIRSIIMTLQRNVSEYSQFVQVINFIYFNQK